MALISVITHTESLLCTIALVSFSFVTCGNYDEKQFSNNFFLECLCVMLYGQMVGFEDCNIVTAAEELGSGLSVVETPCDEGGKSFQLLETVDFC